MHTEILSFCLQMHMKSIGIFFPRVPLHLQLQEKQSTQGNTIYSQSIHQSRDHLFPETFVSGFYQWDEILLLFRGNEILDYLALKPEPSTFYDKADHGCPPKVHFPTQDSKDTV
ncbi:hypothetical protein CEXT_762161 [Caerostris extrusa]|uniref:Uncharacterized protein n=1 Tax=Caerostris extrusa TaxID=172846 RepID=A0AAV4NXY6_CAEEX|nr:hypothetical protein CEXT_762161 [Caerostris extrusa]